MANQRKIPWGSFVVLATLLVLFFMVIQPLLVPLAMGGVFAVMMYPLLARLERKKWKRNRAALFLTTALTLLIIIPAILLVFVGIKAGLSKVGALRELTQGMGEGTIQETLQRFGLGGLLQKVQTWYPSFDLNEVFGTLNESLAAIGIWLVNLMGMLVTQIPSLAMGAVITVLSVFFFLADGYRIEFWARRQTYLSSEATTKLISAFAGLCRTVILASVFAGIFQSFLMLVALLIAGVPNAILWTIIVFLCSFVPLVGSAPVTFGLAIGHLLFVSGSAGIILLVAALLAALSDNVIRPVVMRGGASLHPLVAFVSAFGGISLFGFTGIFLGPILAGLAMKALDLWLETHS